MVSRRMPVIRRILCTLLVCALLTGLLPAAFAAGSDPDFSAPADKVLISQTNYPIVNGLTESQVILNNASGSAQVLGYMATITPGASVKLKASYPNYYTAGSTAESRAETAEEPRLGSEDDHVPGRRLRGRNGRDRRYGCERRLL